MMSSKEQNLVYNIKISSVGPSRVTGTDVFHNLTGLDLAMKLHYLKAVYFFSTQPSQQISIPRIKESMFSCLNDYYMICGRLKRSEEGRPYIKCNDCGARFIEAACDKSISEWLEMEDPSLDDLLVYHLPIGPELLFSPLLYIQVTNFRCGGQSMGLSWAHINGDPFSFTDFMNMWGKFLAGLKSYGPLQLPEPPSKPAKAKPTSDPLSLKRVEPVGDLWAAANDCKMETFSLLLTASQLSLLPSKVRAPNKNDQIPVFEALCALMWQMIAKIRHGVEPKIVTLCKKAPKNSERLSNSQEIRSAKADFSVIHSDLNKLAKLLVDQATNEASQIEEVVEGDNGLSDYIVYGANLTFVDLGGADLYGLEWGGQKPERVHLTIQGVGDEGAVLVLPWPNNLDKDGESGRIVMVTLPENEVAELKFELKKNGLMLESELE